MQDLNFQGLLTCAVIVAGLGVLNDVTITQASASGSCAGPRPNLSRTELFARAMRIGRDHIASTIYTIVFAYAGAALSVLLLLYFYQRPVLSLVSTEEIAEEIVRTLAVGHRAGAGRPDHDRDRDLRRGRHDPAAARSARSRDRPRCRIVAMRVPGRLRRLACWGSSVVLVAGCGGGGPDVFDSAGPAADQRLDPPQYVAAVPGGVLVRRGDHTRRVPQAFDSVWLDDGRLIYNYGLEGRRGDNFTRTRLLDPATGRRSGIFLGGPEGVIEQRSPDLRHSTKLRVPTSYPSSAHGVPRRRRPERRAARGHLPRVVLLRSGGRGERRLRVLPGAGRPGDQVAVQYVHRPVSPADPREIGTFRYTDGHGGEVPGAPGC